MTTCDHQWEEIQRSHLLVRFQCSSCAQYGHRHVLKPTEPIRVYKTAPRIRQEPTVGFSDGPTAFRDQEEDPPELSRRWRDPGSID